MIAKAIIILACVLDFCLGEVKVIASVQTIYDKSPKLIIKGSGFTSDTSEIFLEIVASGETPQKIENYGIFRDDDQLLLSLTANKWIDMKNRGSSVELKLTTFKFLSDPENNLLPNNEPIVIANVILTPTVAQGEVILHKSTSPILRISGTGFTGATSTKLLRTNTIDSHNNGGGSTTTTQLRFDPVLYENLDYSLHVISTTELELTLLPKKMWRNDNGPIRVTAINTRGDGYKWIELSNDNIYVADVVDDINTTGGVEVFYRTTAVYQSIKNQSIDLFGAGFKAGICFTFNTNIIENDDYTMILMNNNHIILTLLPGKKWSLYSGYLVVKSVKIDRKEYHLGGNYGIYIAKIFLDPIIYESHMSYYETQSNLITIKGQGFTTLFYTQIDISPTSRLNYVIYSITDNTIVISLLSGSSWLPFYDDFNDGDTSLLQVLSINTGAGVIEYTSPITIGHIVKDRVGIICDDSCDFAFNGVCDYESTSDLIALPQLDDDNDKDESFIDYTYDDYFKYLTNDINEYKPFACAMGTDCTDCKGQNNATTTTTTTTTTTATTTTTTTTTTSLTSNNLVCTNTCLYALDGECDDPRGHNYCDLGTDCHDCGPIDMGDTTTSTTSKNDDENENEIDDK